MDIIEADLNAAYAQHYLEMLRFSAEEIACALSIPQALLGVEPQPQKDTGAGQNL